MSERLNRQLTYQVFHLGIYVSLATALIGASVFLGNADNSPSAGPAAARAAGFGESSLIALSVICLFLAAACGGIVTAKIPAAPDYSRYLSTKIGIGFAHWEWRPWTPKVWESLEHLFFWIGVLFLLSYAIAPGLHTLCEKGIV